MEMIYALPKGFLHPSQEQIMNKSIRRFASLLLLVAALAFSGCALNDGYTPISGGSSGFAPSPAGQGSGGG